MFRISYLLVVSLLGLVGCSAAEPIATNNSATTMRSASDEAAVAQRSGETAERAFVFDGDSLEATLADGSPVEIRLLGINAPEGDECFGDRARSALESLLGTNPLTLVADDEDTDQFGRLLRYVFADGVNVNLTMLAEGYALAVQTGHGDEAAFVAASDAAAADGLGMWSADACGAATAGSGLTIADYVFDPRGRDADNPNDEWVAIANTAPTQVDMTGWTLRDESTQNRYLFPDGFTLSAGAEVQVHSGCGTDIATDLYWCAANPVWSNGGDTIILQHPGGSFVAKERYAGSY